MPIRPRSHQLEAESKLHFGSVLPSRWVFREANPDYGIDGQIEVFDQSNKATGLMFLVQLKGTDEPNRNDALAVQLKLDTLRYYQKLDLPVMIVLFHSPTKQLFWKWAHEADTNYVERGQEYLTVRMLETVVWRLDTPSLIEGDLTEFRRVRSPSIHLPQTFSIVISESGIHGISRAAFEASLIEASKDVSDVVSLSRLNPPGAHPAILVDSSKIIVSLSGLATLTLHTESYPTEFVVTKLPHDILTAIAFILGSANHHNLAAEIACKHLDKSSFLGTPEIFFRVLQAIAKGRRLTDGLRLAEALLKPETLSLAQLLIVPALMSGGAPLSTSEREYLRHLMMQIIVRLEGDGQKQQAATAHYNLGNHLRAQRGSHDRAALRHYRLAARADPLYLQRHYFWREVGGILFGLGRFAYSASAYEKAIRLGGEDECTALRADALMFAGRYAEAHQLLRKHLNANAPSDAEWQLKSFGLAGIIKAVGVDKQSRNRASAILLADVKVLSPDDAEASLEKAFQCDALCALGWFNFAVNAYVQKKPEESLLGFLLAGLFGRTDPEAWANALLLSFSSSNYSFLFAAIALLAYKINGQRFLDELRKLADRQQHGFPSAKLFDLVWEVVNSVEPALRAFEVRILGGGSNYESIYLGSDLTPTVQHPKESSQSKPFNGTQTIS